MPRPSMDASEIADQAALTRQAEGWLPMSGWTGDQVDWSTVSGGGGIKHANEQAYLDWLYGPGGTVNETEEGNFYRPAGGMGSFQPGRTPMTITPPDSKLGQLTKMGILALGGAGLTGMLPGTENVFASMFGSGGAGAFGGDIAGTAAAGEGAATAAGTGAGVFGGDIAGTAAAGEGITAGAGAEAAASAGAGNGVFGGEIAGAAFGEEGGSLGLMDYLTKIASGITSGAGPAAKASAFDPISSGMSLVSGIYGMKRSNDLMKIAERASAMQDPFGPYRAQYAQQLSGLMADPSKITTMPGYTAGMQAVERRMASQGYLGSGNMMAAMAEYGGSFFDKEANRLAGLAGANINPSGGGVLMNGANASYDAASRALASLGFGIKDIARILAQ